MSKEMLYTENKTVKSKSKSEKTSERKEPLEIMFSIKVL